VRHIAPRVLLPRRRSSAPTPAGSPSTPPSASAPASATALERICRYVARGPLAQDRLTLTRTGDVVYRFRHPWKNGKTAVVMDPMTFLARLAAQVPPPRVHMLS
jgi:hypothetical protein